jgi:hypothetical protein
MGTGITQAAPRHPRNGPLTTCSHARGGTTKQGLCGGVGRTWGLHNTRGRLKNVWGFTGETQRQEGDSRFSVHTVGQRGWTGPSPTTHPP